MRVSLVLKSFTLRHNMRARQRFLKPQSLGATAAYDARFISGLSDGDSISTWNDLTNSANNATNTGSARPLFKTNQFNGQPAVEFSATSSQKLLLTSSISIGTNSESFLITKKTGSFLIGLCTNNAASRGYNFNDYNDANIYVTNSVNGAGCYSANNGNNNSLWTVGPNNVIRLNGAARSLTSLGTLSGFSATQIGARGSEFSTGLIGMMYYFPSALTSSQRSLMERCLALSFKIACS